MKKTFNFAAPPHCRTAAQIWILVLYLPLFLPFVGLQAQCMENGQPRQSYFNILLTMDQKFVNAFGGDIQMARMAAQADLDAGLAALNQNPGSFRDFFKLEFRQIFFPSDVLAPAKPQNLDENGWTIPINQFFRAQFPCVPYDAIVVCTGEFGTALDFGANKVALLGGTANLPVVVAHEIGHALGLSHTTSVPAPSNCCSADMTFMCPSVLASAAITPVNQTCGPGVIGVNSQIFTATDCARLADAPAVFPDEFKCPPEDKISVVISTDNPNPSATACDEVSTDMMTFTVTVINKKTVSNLNIRALLPGASNPTITFVNDPNTDFNCIKDFLSQSSSRMEYWITDPDCTGSEKVFFFEAAEIKSFKFKARINASIFAGLGQHYDFLIRSYVGNNFSAPDAVKDFNIRPFVISYGGNYLALRSSNQWCSSNPMIFLGDIWMDYDYNFQPNNKLIFASGKGMAIIGNNKVEMPNIEIKGCNAMWKGIEVGQNAALDISMSTIEDAQFAAVCYKGATVKATNTFFRNNNFAIVTDPLGAGAYNLTLLSNRYLSSGLKSAYSGQSPAPSSQGFAGIYVENLTSALNIAADPNTGALNEFTGLKYGIITRNSNLTVQSSLFSNILKVSKTAAYNGYVSSFVGTGKGIYMEGGQLTVTGAGGANGPNLQDDFFNCHTGIETRSTSMAVNATKMSQVNYGITNNLLLNGKVSITNNNISASEAGIKAFHQSSLPNGCIVLQNTVTMEGNAKGVGILTGGTDMFPQSQGTFSTNKIKMLNGVTGIQIGPANNLRVIQNPIVLSNTSANREGIRIEGGDKNFVSCNSITGGVSSNSTSMKGIYGLMAGRAAFLCNHTTGTDYGLYFDGVFGGKSATCTVAGNSMSNNPIAGLLLGADALLGEQRHQGNTWGGIGAGLTVARHLGAGLLSGKSMFIVDAAENPGFMPSLVDPFGWFLNQDNPNLSFSCNAANTCPPPPAPPQGGSLDIDIAKGDLTGFAHQGASLWLAQRRLYERLTGEGNPYPGDTDVSNFLTAAQGNGLAAYADVQGGIRQMFNLSAADQTGLGVYDSLLNAGLTQLALVEDSLHRIGLLPQDSAAMSVLRDSVRLHLSQITALRDDRLAVVAAARNNATTNLLLQNAALTGTATYQANEQAVNDIFLRTIARGHFDYTPAQRSVLEAIAPLCPLADGEAVLRARDMLALVQDSAVVYADDINCGVGHPRSNGTGEQTEERLWVYPNPAREHLTIEYRFADKMERCLLLHNALGQLVRRLSLPDGAGKVQISTDNLPAGVYWYTVPSSLSRSTASGKIILND